ncbi:MAG: Gfo/Idh/MocA family oxidoreductase [Candidatus Omnitrophota bacterium]
MSRVTRRNFLKNSLAAGAAFTISGTQASGKVLGANDTVRIAVSGIHGRGGSHIDEFQQMKNVNVVCLVDPDARTFAGRSKQVVDLGGKTPQTFQDIRSALDIKDIDAVSIASTNHWHSLTAIWACQAGKDVYVEKPCSHNVHEGRILVETARKYKRIVQHGTQSRSDRSWWRLAEIAKQGTYGKLLISRGLVYKRRKSIGFQPFDAPPSEVDYNLWLGPAPEQPYNTNLVHYNWHWFWDFGNGDIGNQGVHQMDIARWMIPGAELPKSVICVGGRLGYVDQGETPNTQVAIFDYGETKLIFEVRGLETEPYLGEGTGDIMHFEKGYVVNNKFVPNGGGAAEELPKVEVKLGPDEGHGHFGNFIAAVRSRKKSDLNAEIINGHYSAALCHLANISYRVGREFPFETAPKEFTGCDAAIDALERMKEHLTKNGVNLKEAHYRIGRKLIFNAKKEQFIDDPEANALLTRTYRKPFIVPDKA